MQKSHIIIYQRAIIHLMPHSINKTMLQEISAKNRNDYPVGMSVFKRLP
jgi:hypothetical protein